MKPITARDEAIMAIRNALKARSAKSWSVTGGRGTAWGWITIQSPPARRDEFGCMTDADREELGALLGVHVHSQGESIPAGTHYYREYIARAAGLTPTVLGTPYWD